MCSNATWPGKGYTRLKGQTESQRFHLHQISLILEKYLHIKVDFCRKTLMYQNLI